MRIFCLLLFLLAPIAYAAPQCNREDVGITTVEGIGSVYSSSDASDATETRFYDACFERGVWVLRAPLLIVRETDAGVIVTADNANIESTGAKGTVARLESRGDTVSLEKLRLKLEPSYKIEGFANANYNVVAERGTLIGEKLTLQTAIFDRLDATGAVLDRYQAATAVLEGSKAVLNQLAFGTSQFGLYAQLGSSSAAGVQLSGVNGLVGRNSAGSELTFSSASAIRLENGLYRLEDTTLFIFGLPIRVGRLDYDPSCPFEFPLELNFGNGLTFGLNNVLLSCDGKARGTFVVYNLFSPNPTAKTAVAFSISLLDGSTSLFAGQSLGGTLRTNLALEPLTGFTAGLNLDSGIKLETATEASSSQRTLEIRGGIAQNLIVSPFTFRPKFELGAITESIPTTTREVQAFARGIFSINFAWSLDIFSVTGTWNGRLTYYSSGGFIADYTGSLTSSVNIFDVATLSATFANTEQPSTTPFTTHALAPATTLTGTLRVAPNLGVAPFGEIGVRLEKPVFSIGLGYNLRTAAWISQRADIGFDVAFYDGNVPTNHLGQQFQTPLVTVSPRAYYDLIPKAGNVGANITIYGLSFAYVLGFDITIPKGEFKFNFGIRLR